MSYRQMASAMNTFDLSEVEHEPKIGPMRHDSSVSTVPTNSGIFAFLRNRKGHALYQGSTQAEEDFPAPSVTQFSYESMPPPRYDQTVPELGGFSFVFHGAEQEQHYGSQHTLRRKSTLDQIRRHFGPATSAHPDETGADLRVARPFPDSTSATVGSLSHELPSMSSRSNSLQQSVQRMGVGLGTGSKKRKRGFADEQEEEAAAAFGSRPSLRLLKKKLAFQTTIGAIQRLSTNSKNLTTRGIKPSFALWDGGREPDIRQQARDSALAALEGRRPQVTDTRGGIDARGAFAQDNFVGLLVDEIDFDAFAQQNRNQRPRCSCGFCRECEEQNFSVDYAPNGVSLRDLQNATSHQQ